MIYFCCDHFRRAAVRGSALNGIDFVEVVDRDAPSPALRQRILHVHLLNDPAALVLTRDHVRIEGGERIRDIRVDAVTMGLGPQANIVVVEVDRAGDFSPYRLRLRRGALDDRPPIDFDPMLVVAEFGFKAECPSAFDCKPACDCEDATEPLPEIDYLAKDFAAFLTVMRDRMALLAPGWSERNPADPMMTVLDLLAHTADQISWAQDAAFNEGAIDRCQSRISLRRLVRLVDYAIGEGCNARTHVHVAVSADVVPLAGDPPAIPQGTPLATLLPDAGVTVPNTADRLAPAAAVYETMQDLHSLFAAHGEMAFYSYSDQRCCLPRGATAATLAGHFPDLRIGEVLIFEEIVGPRTGRPADADPANRAPVRLTRIAALDGAAPLADPVTGALITEIEWDAGDALAFPLCISAETDPEFGAAFLPVVSVARGNIVLADHGLTVASEDLGTVPQPSFRLAAADRGCGGGCDRDAPVFAPPRYGPVLANPGLTHAEPLDPAAPAGLSLIQNPARALPQIRLTSQPGGAGWVPVRDLLGSNAFADEFVVETETDGTVRLRFGDDINGHRPEPGTAFAARYRLGSGRGGIIGADRLRHVALPLAQVSGIRNPLPSTGGVVPETMAQIRARAPHAFRGQERAVTRQDYSDISRRLPEIQRAAATWVHTGSWHTVFVSADRFGGGPVDAGLSARLTAHLDLFRMAGYDLNIDPPILVPLEIELQVCVASGHFRADIRRAVLAALAGPIGPDRAPGFFDPDRYSFGETVWLSPMIAAVQAVPGVASVRATTFRRLGDPGAGGLDAERLDMERLEIAQLENDPNFPEHGQLALTLFGGL